MADPTIITVANTKGGGGKSMLSLHLAAALGQWWGTTAFIDADGPQSTAMQWINAWQARADAGKTPIKVPFAAYEAEAGDVDQTVAQIDAAAASGAQYIVIDTPGHIKLAPQIAAALERSTIALVPVKPSTQDGNVLKSNVSMIQEASAANPQLSAAGVIVLAPSRFDEVTEAGYRAIIGRHVDPLLKTVVKDVTSIRNGMGTPIRNRNPYLGIAYELFGDPPAAETA